MPNPLIPHPDTRSLEAAEEKNMNHTPWQSKTFKRTKSLEL
jgi:hypothetical protein